jgi:hypothetical protein
MQLVGQPNRLAENPRPLIWPICLGLVSRISEQVIPGFIPELGVAGQLAIYGLLRAV